MSLDSIWVYWIRITLHNTGLDGRLDQVLNSVLLGHLLSVLACLIGGFELYFAFHDDLLFFTFKFLLSLRRADLDLALVDLIFLMLLSQFSLHLFKHFLLNHAPKGILHSIAC